MPYAQTVGTAALWVDPIPIQNDLLQNPRTK